MLATKVSSAVFERRVTAHGAQDVTLCEWSGSGRHTVRRGRSKRTAANLSHCPYDTRGALVPALDRHGFPYLVASFLGVER